MFIRRFPAVTDLALLRIRLSLLNGPSNQEQATKRETLASRIPEVVVLLVY
jgi:hypothetical protein